MKLFYVAVLACAALITGCTTTNKSSDAQNEVGFVEYTSTKNAKTIALCIADEWDKTGNYLMKLQLRPTTNGYSVWVEQSAETTTKGDTVFRTDITDTPGGSITRYYTITTNKPEWRVALSKCITDVYPKTTAPKPTKSQKLRKLEELRKEGVITEKEYQEKKDALTKKP